MQIILESDSSFFARYPQRQSRIRKPNRGEKAREFSQMGVFPDEWRRIIVWKVPNNVGRQFRQWAGTLIQIPFVQQPHEHYDDTDSVLMPLIEELMEEAAKEYGFAGN